MNIKFPKKIRINIFLFFAISLSQIQATEKDEDTQILENNLILQSNLMLEHALCVKINDGPGCFPEPCYRLIFEKDGKLGATHIVLSHHNFPFSWLPLGYRKVILSSDFLVSECNSEEKKDDGHTFFSSLGEKRFLPNSFPWFEKISSEAQNTLLRDIDFFVRVLFPEIKITSRDSSYFNQFHPLFIFFYCLIKQLAEIPGMDKIANVHFGPHLELEPEQLSNQTILHYLELPMDGLIEAITYEACRLNSPYTFNPIEEDEEDYKREDLNSRNKYWIENTLSEAFQPGKLGLLMFGAAHAGGPHGIITFLKEILIQTNWAKNKRTPSQKRFWKGLHFLRLEQLKGRVWKEISTDY